MKKLSLIMILGCLFTLNIQAQEHLNLKKGLAIQGYDPVAYFQSNMAIEGNENISSKYNDATYYFSTRENLKLFKGNPEAYVPQYGGYCAYAMAEGDKVKIDPKTFKILEGKLYLFYNFRSTNTLKFWNNDEETLLPKANKAWAELIDN